MIPTTGRSTFVMFAATSTGTSTAATSFLYVTQPLPQRGTSPGRSSALQQQPPQGKVKIERIPTCSTHFDPDHTSYNPITILLYIGEGAELALTLTDNFRFKSTFHQYALISRPNNNNKPTSARNSSTGLLIPAISSTINTPLGSLLILIFQYGNGYNTKQLIRIFVSLTSIGDKQQTDSSNQDAAVVVVIIIKKDTLLQCFVLYCYNTDEGDFHALFRT